MKDEFLSSYQAGKAAAKRDAEGRPPWVMPILVVVSIVSGSVSNRLLAQYTSVTVIARYAICIGVVFVAGFIFSTLFKALGKSRLG